MVVAYLAVIDEGGSSLDGSFHDPGTEFLNRDLREDLILSARSPPYRWTGTLSLSGDRSPAYAAHRGSA